MNTPKLAFQFTCDMFDWLYRTRIDGVCTVYDAWTYGRVEVEPGLVNTGKSWGTVNYLSLAEVQNYEHMRTN